MSEPLVLGIETSCDETAVGIVRGRKLLANVISSSVDEHARFGGVVPEIASRAHVEALPSVISKALAESKVKLRDIDAIAVTAGPGLIGALLVGTSAASALSIALAKPIFGVNHLSAHIAVDALESSGPVPPAIALLVSGGHSSILKVGDITGDVTSLGATIDDAAGEAFDKVSRILGLPFPGGPAIDSSSKSGDENAIEFPRGLSQPKDLIEHQFDFSFSGLKTAVARFVSQNPNFKVSDIAASFQEAVVDVLVNKSIAAAKFHGIDNLIIAGGVAANSRLRAVAADRAARAGIRLRIPSPLLCTDNGAMVATLGSLALSAGVAPSSVGFEVSAQFEGFATRR